MARMLGRYAAKGAYWLACKLSRIRTPQRVCKAGPSGEFLGDDAVYAGRRWLSCGVSMSLLTLSQQLDWDHWDHWTCKHDDCEGARCPECGGIDCGDGIEVA